MDFILFNTHANQYNRHAYQYQRFFPYIRKSKTLEHNAFNDNQKPFCRYYITYNLKNDRHTFYWKNKPRQQDDGQHQAKQ